MMIPSPSLSRFSWFGRTVGITLLPILLLVPTLAPSTAVAQSSYSSSLPKPLASSLATIDSLRTHRQFRPALRRLDSLAEAHPHRVAVHWRRALLCSDFGKQAEDDDTALTYHRRALDAAHTALATDSTNAWAHLVTALAQGRITLYVGRSERVRRSRSVKRHADRAIALDSTFAPAYHLRGRWHRQVADLNFFERALVKTFYGGLPDASYKQSVQNFERAIALESKPYNHLELGKTYLRMDRTESAREELQKALETSGSPHDAEYKREARSLLSEMR